MATGLTVSCLLERSRPQGAHYCSTHGLPCDEYTSQQSAQRNRNSFGNHLLALSNCCAVTQFDIVPIPGVPESSSIALLPAVLGILAAGASRASLQARKTEGLRRSILPGRAFVLILNAGPWPAGYQPG